MTDISWNIKMIYYLSDIPQKQVSMDILTKSL